MVILLLYQNNYHILKIICPIEIFNASLMVYFQLYYLIRVLHVTLKILFFTLYL